jgi:transcriptional regulatory protein LevR
LNALEQADDYEYQLIECIQQLLKLAGQAQVQPIFKRNRIANQREMVEMLMLSAEYLDEETIVSKLPFISPDEIQQILERRDAEMQSRLKRETAQREELMQAVPDTTEEDEGQGGEV